MGEAERRLDYCIAGSQKAATSTLSNMLVQHRLVQRMPRKELHWFDDESRDWAGRDYRGLEVPARSTKNGRPLLAGDATPLYLWWPQALERLHAYNPGIRLIALVRDPIERLFSHWVMNLDRWPAVADDWPAFISRRAPDGLDDRVPDHNLPGYRMKSGVVRGYYGAQIDRALSIFAPDQLRVLEFRAFLADHEAAVNDITDHLGLPRFRSVPKLPHAMRGASQVVGTAPTAADVASLAERYADDLDLLVGRTGLEIEHWPTRQVLTGRLTAADFAAKLGRNVVPLSADEPTPRAIRPDRRATDRPDEQPDDQP